MKKLMNAFLKDEDGAVTVDWVVLTAAIVGIALAVTLTIESSLNTAAGSISTGIISNVNAALS